MMIWTRPCAPAAPTVLAVAPEPIAPPAPTVNDSVEPTGGAPDCPAVHVDSTNEPEPPPPADQAL